MPALALVPSIIGGALKYWKLIGLGLLALALGIQTLRVGSLKRQDLKDKAAQIDPVTKLKWQAEYVVAAKNYATCQSNELSLRSGLDTQSAAVTALQAQGSADTARANAAVQQARIATQAASKAVATIMAPTKDHSCAAAQALIAGQAQ